MDVKKGDAHETICFLLLQHGFHKIAVTQYPFIAFEMDPLCPCRLCLRLKITAYPVRTLLMTPEIRECPVLTSR